MSTKTTRGASTAKKVPARKLALTSRAKMGAARKARGANKPKVKPAADLKATLQATLAAVAEVVQPVVDAIGAAPCTDTGPAAEIGEPVKAAKAKAPKAPKVRKDRMAPAIKSLKVVLEGIRGVDPVVARTYAEMLASGVGVTPREVETATGLNTRQRCAVDRRLGKAGYRLKHRRNPERAVKSDRLTACLYWIEG